MNIQAIMKQMQKVQEDAARVQEELGASTVEGTSGGGAVKIALTGSYEVKSVSIAAEALEGADREMVEDLVRAALEDALSRVGSMTREAMSKTLAGVRIPGMPGM